MKQWKCGKSRCVMLLIGALLSSCGQPAVPDDRQTPVPMLSTTAGEQATPPPSLNPEDEGWMPTFTANDILPFVEIPTNLRDDPQTGRIGLSLQRDTAGNFYYLEPIPQNPQEERKNWIFDHSVLRKCDPSFSPLWEVICPPDSDTFLVAQDGIWVLMGDENVIVCYGEDGREKRRLSIPPAEVGNYGGMIRTGRYICMLDRLFQPETNSIINYVIIDIETGEFKSYDTADLPREENAQLLDTYLLSYKDNRFCLLSQKIEKLDVTPSIGVIDTLERPRIDIIDAATGQSTDHFDLGDRTQEHHIYRSTASAVVYDGEKDLFYFYGENAGQDIDEDDHVKLFAQRKGEEPGIIADMPSLMSQQPSLQLISDQILLWYSYSRNLFSIDKNLREAERPNSLVVQGENPSAAAQFRQQNSGWDVKSVEQTAEQDNTALLLRQDSSVDIYYMADYNVDIPSLIKNGYYIDLSKSELLKQSVNGMYPVLKDSAMNGNVLWGYPASYMYDRMYVNADYQGAPPRTWMELIQVLEKDPKALMGYPGGMMVHQACAVSEGMNSEQRQQLWREVLSNLKRLSELVPSTGTDSFNPAASLALGFGIMEEAGSRDIPLERMAAVPALNEETAGRTQLRIDYYVVNPYSKNQDKAIAYLEAMAGTVQSKPLSPLSSIAGSSKQFFDSMMENAEVYRWPMYFDNLFTVVNNYLDGQLTQEAALEEIENIYRLAQRG